MPLKTHEWSSHRENDWRNELALGATPRGNYLDEDHITRYVSMYYMIDSIAGEASHDAVAILKFPDMQTQEAAFASDAYQAIVALREEGADITIVKYEQAP